MCVCLLTHPYNYVCVHVDLFLFHAGVTARGMQKGLSAFLLGFFVILLTCHNKNAGRRREPTLDGTSFLQSRRSQIGILVTVYRNRWEPRQTCASHVAVPSTPAGFKTTPR